MSGLMMILFLVSIYFMLYPQDAYSRFNIGFRNQIKFLIGVFAVYGALNLVRVINGISVGVFPGFALVMLIVDVLIVKHYIKQLN